MFKFLSGSGGSSKKEESKKKASALGIDPALFEDPKFDDMEDTQMDMPQETVDVSALISEVDNDAPIEVTDDDMNDPELLAELNEISDPSSEDKLNMIQTLREQVALEKKKALTLNSNGDKEGARKALTNAKTLQSQLNQLTGSHEASSAPTHTTTATPAPVVSAPVASAPKPAPVAAKPAPARAPAPVKIEDEEMDDDDAPVDSKQATELRNRIKVYTAAALTHKQAGNRKAALQYMHSINIFKKALEDADMGFPVDMKSLPSATPPPVSDDGDDVSVSASSSSGGVPRNTAPAMTVMTAAQREAQQRKQTLDTLIGEIAKTVEVHKTATLAAKSAGDMTGAKQRLVQLKEAQSQQASLQAALNDPSIPLPAHHFEVKETKTEVAFANLAPHDLEVTILNIKDLRPPSGYTTLSLYVYAEVQFNEKDSVQKIQTPTINNSLAPEYNHTSKLMIDRNKSFLRYVEKRKITFQVYHSKFFGNLQIGKAEMKISELTDKAEIQEDIPIIKDGTRRPVGGTLSVRIRLKTPLVKKDVRITRETILVIDGTFPTAAPPIASPVSTPTKTTPVTSPSSTPAPTPKTPTPQAAAKPPATSSPAPVTATSSASTPATSPAKVPAQPAPAQEDEMDLEDVNNVDNIVSNDVLENEISMVDAQIAQYLQKKQPVPEALTDRKQGLELKMNILVMQVQTGAITPEKYIDMLKAKVDQEMALAKKLVTIGKKDWAKYPLTRAKIMKNEIESASAEDDE